MADPADNDQHDCKRDVKEGRIRLENAGHKKEKQIFLTEKGRLYADHILKSVYEAEEKAVERTLKEFYTGASYRAGSVYRISERRIPKRNTG